MAPDPAACRARSLLLSLLRGAVVGLVGASGGHLGWVLLVSNFHVVVPAMVYRTNQPSAEQLRRLITTYHIRTVINLRGFGYGADWYRNEARVTSEMGVSQEDLGFSAVRLPSPQALCQLIEVIDRSAHPIIFHCFQGADRTGLAVAVWFLLRPGVSFAQARRHLGPATGHLPVGRTRYIDSFFDLYQNWLTQHVVEHSPAVFREWVSGHYCPDGGRAEFAVIDPPLPPGAVLALKPRQSSVLTIRCRNTSIGPWRMQTGPNAGIHLIWYLVDDKERWLRLDRAGLLDRQVHPGEYIDLRIPLPGLPPGRFQLRVDLFDAQQGSFLQLGNDLLLVDVEVS
jgi:hypothetical protein